MRMKLRRSPQTSQVLHGLLRSPQEWRHGYEMSLNTGLKSGTLYPILIRLAERQLLETKWEDPKNGRPPRHLYRLTQRGIEVAQNSVIESQPLTSTKPAFGM